MSNHNLENLEKLFDNKEIQCVLLELETIPSLQEKKSYLNLATNN